METTFTKNGTAFDSLEAMNVQIVASALNPTIQKLAKKLEGLPRMNQLYTIFKTAYDLAYFEGDNDTKNTVRDAVRLIQDKKANCVDYSVFIGAFLLLLDIPFKLRMVSESEPDKWTHVYVKTLDGITLDAVLGQDQNGGEFKSRQGRKPMFNTEVPFKYKYDLDL